MANNIKGITIRIGADTMGLDSALKGVEQKSKKTSDEIKEINRNIKVAGDSAVAWKQKQELLTTAIDDSRKKLKLLEDAQEQVNDQVKKGKINEDQYRAFQREVEYARAEVKRYEGQLITANEKVKELGNSSGKAADEVEDFGKETETAGEKARVSASGGLTAMKIALGTLIADGIRAAGRELKDFAKDVVQTGMDFEAAMSQVGAISGANTEELEKLTAKAREMGAVTKFSGEESAEAMKYMAMAGWKAEDMIGGIEGIMGLAAASGEDLATTSDIVTDALTAFGLKAADSGHFADVLAAASSNANTNVSMLGESFKYCAPIAGALGFSCEDTAEALGIMANSGIKASQAGTSMRAIMTALAGKIKFCGESIGEVEIATSNADGSMRELNDILSDCRAAFSQLSESEKASAADALVGKNAMSGFISLLSAAPADVDKLSSAIQNCEGSATNMSKAMQDNLAGDVERLGGAMDEVKLTLANEFTPILRTITEDTEKKVGKISDNLPAAMTVIKRKVLPVIEIIGGGLKNAIGFVVKFVDVITGFSSDVKRQRMFDEITESAHKLEKKVDDDIAKMKELRDTAKNQTQIDLADTYKTEALFDELRTLVDENGKVKAGYEDRVNFIVGELQDATGIEITQIDGVIQKYGELKNTIEEVLNKQRAEIFSKNYADMYSQALVNNSKISADVRMARQEQADAQDIIDEVNDEVRKMFPDGVEIYENGKKVTVRGGDINARNFTKTIDRWRKAGIVNEGDDLDLKLAAAMEKYRSAGSTLAKSYGEINSNNDIISQYELGQQALANGNYSLAQGYFAGIGNETIASMRDINGAADEVIESIKSKVDDALEEYNIAVERDIKNGKSSAESAIKQLADMIATEGLSSAEILKTGIVEALSSIDSFDTTALMSFMEQTGVQFRDILSQIGLKGLASSPAVNQLLYQRNELITDNVNSPGDAALRKIGKYATGGYIPMGGKGIVAEAGPELLTVMNGGIKVTPLSKTARNSVANSSGGTTINNYNNYVSAQISGRYDVYGMAEDMATAERRIEFGKGR